MGGIVGRFMNSFGVTMAFAIAVSLLVSFTLTPMMCSRWLKPQDAGTANAGHASTREKGFYATIERDYLWLLDGSMAHRWIVVLALIIVFVSTGPLFTRVNKKSLPADDELQFEVTLRTPEGSSLEATQTVAESIARRVHQYKEVEATVLTVANDPQRTQNLASVYVKLVPVGKRKVDQFVVMDRIRQQVLPAYARLNLRTQVAPVSAIGGGNNAEIQFWVGGPDLDQLAKYSAKLLADLKSVPGVVDADSNLIVGQPELGVRIYRAKAADLGVHVQDVASTVNVLVGGQEVTSYMEAGEQYEVHVRADRPLPPRSAGNRPGRGPLRGPRLWLALRDVVELRPGTGPSLINRIARQRQVLLYANMLPGFSSQTVLDKLAKSASELKMPPAYSSGFTGRSREQGKAAKNFGLAFLLSIVFMYLILAAQFESWLHPATILLALPMTVPFALFSLIVLNQSLKYFLGARRPRALRHRQEEQHSADRPHDQPPRPRPLPGGGNPRGQPRPAAADPHDHHGLRRRHDSARCLFRHRRRHQPGHRLGDHRWPDPRPPPHPDRHPGRLQPVRRPRGSTHLRSDRRPPLPPGPASPASEGAGRGVESGACEGRVNPGGRRGGYSGLPPTEPTVPRGGTPSGRNQPEDARRAATGRCHGCRLPTCAPDLVHRTL